MPLFMTLTTVLYTLVLYTGLAHATSTTPTTTSTQCTYSLGYYKKHYSEGWPNSVIQSGLVLGNSTYTAAQLESILNETPSKSTCTSVPCVSE